MNVSVIIPALNEAEHIVQSIDRAWLAGADEVIVVDGGSRDQTCSLAQMANCQLLKSSLGRGVQQNMGAQVASGDVLLFLHADNWLPSGAIDQIRLAIQRDASAGCFRQQIQSAGRIYRLIERGNAWRARRLRLPYGDQGLFIRRELFEKIGGFPDYPIMEDVGLMKRFRGQGKLVLLPGPLHISARRWQRQGTVRQTLRNWALVVAFHLGVAPKTLAKFYPVYDSVEQPN